MMVPRTTLSPAAPGRELREAKEDGIERKDGMHDLKQSNRRNKSIIISADQRTSVRHWRYLLLLLLFQHQYWLRGVNVQSAAFRLRLCFCFYFRFCGSLGNLDPCDARVRGCIYALAVACIASLGLFTGRVGGSVGRYRRSILIVDRLYYRIIRRGLFFLSLCIRCFAFLFLFLFLFL